MDEQHLKIFVDSVVNYFALADREGVEVGTPYLVDNMVPQVFDYSGVIAISGCRQGYVYYTAPRAMLRHLLLSLGEADTGADNMRDLVGEVANTISGNVRQEFGREFQITVPNVVDDVAQSLNLPVDDRSYVVPIYWKKYHSAVVVYLSATTH